MIGCSKKTEKIIRENAFEQQKKKTWLSANSAFEQLDLDRFWIPPKFPA